MELEIEAVSKYLLAVCFYGTIGIAVLWIGLYINIHRVKVRRNGCTESGLGLPFIGSALEFVLQDVDAFSLILFFNLGKRANTSIRTFKLGFHQFASMMTPKSVEIILTSKDHITKAIGYKFISPWLGDGLLLSTGSKWFTRRKMLTPAFHFKILDAFLSVFNEQSQVLIQNFQKELGSKSFDIVNYITPCTLDIICETTMGVKIHAQSNRDSAYFRAINRVTEIFIYRTFRPWLHSERLFGLTWMGRENKQLIKVLHNFTDEVITKRKAELKQKKSKWEELIESDDTHFGEKRKRLLDFLIHAAEKGNLTDKDIREEVDTFMFEGHDTTAMAISWCLYLLATSPEHQKRVHEELDSIFGEDDRHVSKEDISKMTYLDMCIKETLRLYPSVPIIGRELNKEEKILDATFPKGTNIMVIPLSLHRLPESFPNPEVFNPENFLPERIEKRHPFAYIPFSAGSRNCIGQKFAMMEQKVILSTVLRCFELEAVDKRDDIVIIADVVLRPKNGLRIRIKNRKS